jgi:hypothetical protein
MNESVPKATPAEALTPRRRQSCGEQSGRMRDE